MLFLLNKKAYYVDLKNNNSKTILNFWVRE